MGWLKGPLNPTDQPTVSIKMSIFCVCVSFFFFFLFSTEHRDLLFYIFQCYDTGYCVCDPDNAITRTVTLDTDPPGDAATGTYFETDLCLIAPNWVKAASSGKLYVQFEHILVEIFQDICIVTLHYK